MHKDWVRLDAEREQKFWEDYDNRPAYHRYVEETSEKYPGGSTFVEYWEDVRDPGDEPEVDGVYVDKDGDLWLRINDHWTTDDTGLTSLIPWEEEWAEFAPFRLLDPSEY